MAYVLLTPWFFYWYMLTPLVLVAVLPRNRITIPLLVFSATTWISFTLPSGPATWILVTLSRYGPPFAVFALQHRVRPIMARGTSAPSNVPLQVRTGSAVPQTAPAAK
jgi:hypothetical protein